MHIPPRPMRLPSLCRDGEGKKLLLHAICNRTNMKVAGRLRAIKKIVPLVCDQVWSMILTGYPHSRLKVLVEQNRPEAVCHTKSTSSCTMGNDDH